MTKAQESAIARAAQHENLPGELVSALQALLDSVDSGGVGFYNTLDFWHAIDAARVALARAKGAQ